MANRNKKNNKSDMRGLQINSNVSIQIIQCKWSIVISTRIWKIMKIFCKLYIKQYLIKMKLNKRQHLEEKSRSIVTWAKLKVIINDKEAKEQLIN